jgi:hypothetical protein
VSTLWQGPVLMTSAPVTNWPIRLLLVALVAAIIIAVLWAMLRGWRNRERRQSFLPEPARIPPRDQPSQPGIAGVYLGSVFAGDWLDRVAAHGLGTRSRIELQARADGLDMCRSGARSFFIPVRDLVAVRRERGIAGKAFEKDAVVVITWTLGDSAVDTGIRPDSGEDGDRLVEMVGALIVDPAPMPDQSSDGQGTTSDGMETTS